MATPQNFRSAFNGFNRDDVVNYISFITTKHDNQLNQLRTELEQVRQELAERPEVPELDESELNALREQVAQLQQQIAQRDETIARLQSKTPAAPAADTPTYAEQELTAYRRAENAERRAMERVDQMYARANGILADTVARLNENTVLVDQLAERVRGELEALEDAVNQSKLLLRDCGASVSAVRPEE